MKCQRFRDRIDEYLDNETDQGAKQAMKDHEACCAECRSRVQQRQNLFQKITTGDNTAGFKDMSGVVMNRIRELPPLNQPNPFHKPLIFALVTALLASGTLILIAYRSLPDTISPVDLIRLVAGSVHLPEGMQASLNELLSFLNVCWIIFRTMTQIVVQLALLLLLSTTVTIPLLIFMTSGVFIVIWRYRKYRKQSFTSGLFL